TVGHSCVTIRFMSTRRHNGCPHSGQSHFPVCQNWHNPGSRGRQYSTRLHWYSGVVTFLVPATATHTLHADGSSPGTAKSDPFPVCWLSANKVIPNSARVKMVN